jgi:hypothetical protein
MKIIRSCATNRTARWLRIAVSLGIIGAGIYFHRWIGLLGIIPLMSALSGSCGLTLKFGKTRPQGLPPPLE